MACNLLSISIIKVVFKPIFNTDSQYLVFFFWDKHLVFMVNLSVCVCVCIEREYFFCSFYGDDIIRELWIL